MSHNIIVKNRPIFNKCTLEGTHYSTKDSFKFIDNNFGSYFVDNIAQTNRSEITSTLRVTFFGIKIIKVLLILLREDLCLKKS